MALIQSFFSAVTTWFGFVSACVAGPTAACRPLLGFVLLTAVSGVALFFLLKAYRALQQREAHRSVQRTRLQPNFAETAERLSENLSPNVVAQRNWRIPA